MKKTTTIIAMLLITLNSIATPINYTKNKSVTVVRGASKSNTPYKNTLQGFGTHLNNQEVIVWFTIKQMDKLYSIRYDDKFNKVVKSYIRKQYKELNDKDLNALSNRIATILERVID